MPAGGAIRGHLLQHAVDGAVQRPLEILFLSEECGLDYGGISGLLTIHGVFLVLLDTVEHWYDVEVLPGQPLVTTLLFLCGSHPVFETIA